MLYTNSKNIRARNPLHRLAKPKFVLSGLLFLAVMLTLVANASVVVSQDRVLEVYPTPKIAQKSNTYAVTVNGKSVFVNKYNSINYVHFAFAGTADIEISYKEPIKTYTISPKSANIPTRKNGQKISVSLKVPRKLILHKVNGLGEELYILADPLEDNPPQLGNANVTNLLNYGVDSTGTNDVTDKIQQAINEVSANKGVLYIPPGVYKTKQLNLKSNMTLYLAGGSVLEGTKEINPSYGQGVLQLENVSNIKIMGRGEIRGNWSYWSPRSGWYSLINLMNTNNIRVEDVLLIDPPVGDVWIQYAEDCTFYNTKTLAVLPYPDLGRYPNVGGFNFWSSRNITIDNIIFRGTDDATSLGGDKQRTIKDTENINVRNSTLYNVYAGGAFKIGTTTKQDFIRNVTYENIDVVFANSLAGLWAVTKANFENIYFKNIRVEDMLDAPKGDAEASLLTFRIMVANWEPTSSPNNLGYIKNVYFQNLTVDDSGMNSSFQGYDSQRDISNVTFDNFYIKGKLVTKLENAFFSLMPSYKDGNNYVKLIKFTQSNPTIVNITANRMYASTGDVGEFIVTRTGDKSQSLRVKYTIRGTAKNGKDYKTISNYVTIPVGAASAKISIQPIQNNKNKGLKTVFVSLENLPNSTQYMLGANFHTVVNIRDL